MNTRREDLTDKVFGRLTAIKLDHITNRGHAYWVCKCLCGNIKIVRASHLKEGAVKSCGCLCRETSSNTAKKYLAGKKYKLTHGCSNTRIFKIWMAMKRRCYYKKAINYSNYGGRGISICAEWLNSFQAFMEWSTNNGYTDNLTIDRINNDGNYEPENCRWASKTTQGNNRSTCHYVTYKGETHTVIEWERKLGLPKNLIAKRLSRKWSVKKAIETPKGDYRCHKI